MWLAFGRRCREMDRSNEALALALLPVLADRRIAASFTSQHRSTRLHKENKRVWLPESVGFNARDCTDLQNRGYSDDPGLGQ